MQIEDRFLKSYSRSTYQKVVKETFFSNKIPTVEIVPEGTILPVIDNGGGGGN